MVCKIEGRGEIEQNALMTGLAVISFLIPKEFVKIDIHSLILEIHCLAIEFWYLHLIVVDNIWYR